MIGRGTGRVVATRGSLLEAELPCACVGDGVRVRGASALLAARVAALAGTRVLLAPFAALDGVAIGDRVDVAPEALALPLGTGLVGRAIDAAGDPLDGRPAARTRRVPVTADAGALADRRPPREVCWTGVRAIDGPLAFGRGARIGVFGAPGAGKSSLLEAIVRGADADAVVVALVGERGREAQRWVASCDPRTTIVCATADRTAPVRVRAAEVAFAQAAALRAAGLDVLLVVDSLARICGAAREIALAAGEATGRGGYPPSVFAMMGRLLESAGADARGSVTVVATVLSDGPEDHDPLAEQARAALDGHLVLSERLARAGRFPAIDLSKSASRTLADVASGPHLAAARALRAAVAALDDARDTRAAGLDPAAHDPFLARCVGAEPAIERFLRQDGVASEPGAALTELFALADTL